MVFPKLPKPSSSSSYIFKAMIFFFLDFSKAPKAMLFSSFFPKLHGDGFFFSWSKLQNHGLLFRGFVQSSQSHLLIGHAPKAMVLFFLNFSKAPKVIVFILVFPKAPWSWSSCVAFGYWLTCLLFYWTLWLFVALIFLSSPPLPPHVFCFNN